MDRNVVYSYKRENHFNEWVSQFQAKESTSVPPEVIEQLRSEFKKQKIKELSEITHEKVKALLKKLDRYAVVVLDDIGYVQQSREEMEVLFTFLAERYERRSVMITSKVGMATSKRLPIKPSITATPESKTTDRETSADR